MQAGGWRPSVTVRRQPNRQGSGTCGTRLSLWKTPSPKKPSERQDRAAISAVRGAEDLDLDREFPASSGGRFRAEDAGRIRGAVGTGRAGRADQLGGHTRRRTGRGGDGHADFARGSGAATHLQTVVLGSRYGSGGAIHGLREALRIRFSEALRDGVSGQSRNAFADAQSGRGARGFTKSPHHARRQAGRSGADRTSEGAVL
jgi:hypothetical protein